MKGRRSAGLGSVKKKEKREKERDKINLIKEERETNYYYYYYYYYFATSNLESHPNCQSSNPTKDKISSK